MSNLLHSLYGRTAACNQRIFTDVFPDQTTFLNFVDEECKIPLMISVENATTLYYLLYAKFGNSHIASSDENQFKYKLAQIIFSYGPTWEKRLELQNRLRGLTEAELKLSSQTILNHAYNPSTDPVNDTRQIMDKLDQQNVRYTDRGVLDGYERLLMLLDTDVTDEFLRKFSRLFIKFVYPGGHLYYESEAEGENP